MQEKINQAIILSAGLGTRLRPITDNIPKVMVPIVGKPILEWHIEQFKKHGVSEFFINLHYLPDAIKNYFGDGTKWDVKINYSLELPEILGTAGGIKQFEPYLAENFFVMYGDMFSLVDYSKMAEEFFKKPDAIGMMIVGRNDHPWDSDLVEVDEDLRFLKIHTKPHGYNELLENMRTLDAGYIFNKKILKYIPSGIPFDLDRQLLPQILAKGEKFYGYETNDYLYDIGTMERYLAVEEYIQNLTKE
ncbi:MAG: nucleotidyltransferase family protein [Patescibacteria group bacterium]|nr:nucleotidyltransferase family protein [Patescibacteria group bacterium]MDE2015277.1 nucleotidyltransferase family protein [Patescibacteria group bacterium]MDE2227083.1 nucleotidyltransferase family protein [Patescibacteria group bacterium]